MAIQRLTKGFLPYFHPDDVAALMRRYRESCGTTVEIELPDDCRSIALSRGGMELYHGAIRDIRWADEHRVTATDIAWLWAMVAQAATMPCWIDCPDCFEPTKPSPV